MKVLKPRFDNCRRAPNPQLSKSLLQLRETQTAAALMIGVYGKKVNSKLNELRILNNRTRIGGQWSGKGLPGRQPLSRGELFVLNVHEAQLLSGRTRVMAWRSR